MIYNLADNLNNINVDYPSIEKIQNSDLVIESQNLNDLNDRNPIYQTTERQSKVVQLHGKSLIMKKQHRELSPSEIKFWTEFLDPDGLNEANELKQTISKIDTTSEGEKDFIKIRDGSKSGPMGKAISKLQSNKYKQHNSYNSYSVKNPSSRPSTGGRTGLARTNNNKPAAPAPSPGFDFRHRLPPSSADMPIPSKPRLTRVNHGVDDIIENQDFSDKSLINSDSSVNSDLPPRGGGIFSDKSQLQCQQPAEGVAFSTTVGDAKFQSFGANGELKDAEMHFTMGRLKGFAGGGKNGTSPVDRALATAKAVADTNAQAAITKADRNIINKAAGCLGHTHEDTFRQNYTGVATEGCSRAVSGDHRYILPCTGVVAGPGLVAADIAQACGQSNVAGQSVTASFAGVTSHTLGVHKTAALIIEDSMANMPEPTPAPIISQFTGS